MFITIMHHKPTLRKLNRVNFITQSSMHIEQALSPHR